MKIKKLAYNIELDKKELLLLHAGIAAIYCRSVDEEEKEFIEKLHKVMHEALKDA
jgi:hypothetical protein